MNKFKLLVAPLLVIPFVIGCNNGGGDKPTEVKFSLSSDWPIKVLEDNKTAEVSVDWTPNDIIKFESFTFNATPTKGNTVTFDPAGEPRPMRVTISFNSDITEDVHGILKFSYEDVTTKSKGESSLTFTIPASGPEHPIPEELTEIEDGLYSMTFRDDYVEDYMSKGGGSNDAAILNYAKAHISDDPILDLYEPIEGHGACSSFNCLNDEGGYIHCRNLDLLPPQVHNTYPSIIMHNIPRQGYESISFTSFANMGLKFKIDDVNPFDHEQAFKIFELIPLDGINSEGLAVNINDISDEHSRVNQTEGGKNNVTTTILVRLLLNKARNVEEAINLIKSYNVHDSTTRDTAYHIMISDASGASVVVEFYDNVIQTIYKGTDDKILTMTNTEMNSYFPQEGAGSWKECDRYKKLIAKFNEYNKDLSEDEAVEVLKVATQDSTTHSIVYNLQKKSVYFCRSKQWGNMHLYDL